MKTMTIFTPSAAYHLGFSKTLTDGEYDFRTPISEDSTPEEIFANQELRMRKVFGDFIIDYAENLHSTIALTDFSVDLTDFWLKNLLV
jgi:hypothetical protein